MVCQFMSRDSSCLGNFLPRFFLDQMKRWKQTIKDVTLDAHLVLTTSVESSVDPWMAAAGKAFSEKV